MQFIAALHIVRDPSRQHWGALLRRKYGVENVGGAWLCCTYRSARLNRCPDRWPRQALPVRSRSRGSAKSHN